MTKADLTPRQVETIHKQVARMLERSPGYRAMDAAQRADITRNTASIVEVLAARTRPGGQDPYASALEDSPAPASPPRWRPDERFQAEGIAAGVTQVGRMINEVDFPGFVASLVKGTFQAVVDASIQQMKAYGELVQSVAMSLNDFRDQNVSPDQGVQHLASKYPRHFQAAKSKDGASLQALVRDDADLDNLPDFVKDLGFPEPVSDIDDEEVIARLVDAARDDLARGRQQLLATTILMGINRIIVTDGKINAKLKFDFKASDTLARQGTVDDYETHTLVYEQESGLGIGKAYARGRLELPVPIKVSTTRGQSTAEIEASAKLSGEVNLNFRSETFPLERMMSSEQLFHLNQAQAGPRGVPAAPAPPATPAPAAPPPAAPPPPQA